MKKQLSIFALLFALGIFLISASFASAAVTSCVAINLSETAANTGAWPYYNDTGVVKNVTEGNVCINSTSYDVDAQLSAYCELYRDCVADQCWIESIFAGFKGDGTLNCSTNTSLLSTPVGINGPTIGVDYEYRVNVTSKSIATISTGSGCSAQTTTASALHWCGASPYLLYNNASYCDGFKEPLANYNVTSGEVCSAGSSVAPNSTNNCATWNQCVEGAESYPTFYTGYLGDGTATCTDTNWVATGSTVTLTVGYISQTENTASVCSAITIADSKTASGITNTKNITYAAFALLAVMILAMVAWGIISIFNGGNADLTMIAVLAIGGGVVLVVAYYIIYFIATALGA